MLDPSLRVRTVVSGLTLPIGLAFLAPNEMLVLEKDTGQVKRVVDGMVTGTVLDLGVNRIPSGDCWASRCIRTFPSTRRVSVLDLPQHRAACRSLLSR